MPAFSSLGELSSYLEARPDVRVVDAPVPLSSYLDGDGYGPAWRSQPAVRKVVGFIARHLASIPLHVYDRVSDTDRVRVRDGALATVIKKPTQSPGRTTYRFWEALLIDGLLKDRWVAMKVALDGGGMHLVRVPAYRTRLNKDGLDQIDSVSLWVDGREQKLDPAKFVLDVGYAERGANGTSPLITMKHLLDESREAVEYRRQIWRRGARVPAVVERSKPWPKQGNARERFIQSLTAYQRGGGQEGATLLLEDDMKYREARTFNPQELGDLEGRRLADIEVCSSYYIAPELLGIREGTYSNIDAYRQMLWSINLGPYIVAWEQAVNASIVPELAAGTDQYVEAHVDAKLRGSFEDQAKYLQTATGAPYLTRNEARSRLNQPAVEGGDDLVVPLNVLVGGQASPRDGQTAGGGGSMVDAAAIGNLVDAAATLIRSGFDPVGALEAVGLDPIEHLGLLPVTVQRPQEPEHVDQEAVDDLKLDRGHRKVVGPRRVRGKGRAPSTHDARYVEVLGAFFGRQRASVVSKLGADSAGWWDADRWNSELAGDLYRLAVMTAADIGAATAVALGYDEDAYDPDLTIAFLLETTQRSAEGINDRTKADIEKQLADLDEDQDRTDAATHVFDIAETSRVAALAVAAVTTFSGFATVEAGKQIGAGTKTWNTGSNPRSAHARMDGETVAIDQKFSNGLLWPGDSAGDADDLAGCNCGLTINPA